MSFSSDLYLLSSRSMAARMREGSTAVVSDSPVLTEFRPTRSLTTVPHAQAAVFPTHALSQNYTSDRHIFDLSSKS